MKVDIISATKRSSETSPQNSLFAPTKKVLKINTKMQPNKKFYSHPKNITKSNLELSNISVSRLDIQFFFVRNNNAVHKKHFIQTGKQKIGCEPFFE